MGISRELDVGGHMNSRSRSIKYEEDDDTDPGLTKWFVCGLHSKKGGERSGDDYTMVSQRGIRRTSKRVGFNAEQFNQVPGHFQRSPSSLDHSERCRKHMGQYERHRELERSSRQMDEPYTPSYSLEAS